MQQHVKGLILVSAFHLILCLAVSGQTSNCNLDQRISVKFEKSAFGNVIRYLMKNYDVAFGFEESINDRDHSEFDFDVNLPAIIEATGSGNTISISATRLYQANKFQLSVVKENARLGEILDQITSQMRSYEWKCVNDVVNIFPKNGRDKRFDELLKTNVKRFSLEAGATIADITVAIKRLPEFKEFLQRNKLYFNGIRTGPSPLIEAQYGRSLVEPLEFSNLTMRELLNRITKTKRGGWILRWKGISISNGTEGIDIDI